VENYAEVRKQCMQQWTALKQERQSWESHWRELSDYFLPRRSKFLSGEKTQGGKKNDKIINSVGTFSVRTLGAGMMSGITSPARQWFRLTTDDPSLAKYSAVRTWLDDIERRLVLLMAKSNLYNALSALYPDLGVFCTGSLYIEEDPLSVFRAYVQPIGTYCLANNDRLEVDTVYRHVVMTVKQVVAKFGLDKCSQRVRNAYEKHNLMEKVSILHAVEPNADYAPAKAGGRAMQYRSLWLEESCAEGEGFLYQGGFEEFPYMSPRWEVTAEEAYGSGPGMMVLGDVKALQQYERRKAQAIDKIVDPPMVAPASLEHSRVGLLPGDVTYVDLLGPGMRFAPAVEVNPAVVTVASEAIREHELRIQRAFFADLWLMLSQIDQKMTATEVMARQQEKMLQLGPVSQRIEQELLTPIVKRCLGAMDRRGLLPPQPQEMKGQPVRIEFTSVMAEAQQLGRTQKLDRMVSVAGGLAGVKPEVLDKVDFDAVMDEYAEALNIDGTVIRDEKDVQALREERAKQQQQAAAMQQQAAMAEGAKTLSQADTAGDNALTRLMGPLQQAAAGGATGGLPQ
jgi:hypothetical protein